MTYLVQDADSKQSGGADRKSSSASASAADPNTQLALNLGTCCSVLFQINEFCEARWVECSCLKKIASGSSGVIRLFW
jgi:hypothetical protein